MAYDWQKKKYEATHDKLLEVASITLRQTGMDRTSVARVMANAGMTVGAFYAHFASKKDMIKKCFAWAVNRSRERIDNIPQHHAGERLETFLDRSLSVQHRDSPGEGCPLSALSLDFSRADQDLRDFYADTLAATLRHRATAFAADDSPLSEEELIEFHSTLIGALIIARATRGSDLSQRWMDVIKSRLKQRFINESKEDST